VGVARQRERGSGGCVGFMWSRLIVGEAEAVPGDGVVEGVLQVLWLGSATAATCSADLAKMKSTVRMGRAS
jgi:hypothetical protein